MTSAIKPKTRIFLVDDHPIVRRGLQLLIGIEPGISVCGEADSAPIALDRILALKPDLVIVDLALRSSNGLDLIKQLRQQLPAVKILVFTMRSELFYAERALRAGAHGYITKEEGAERAIGAIHLVLQGKICLSPALTEVLVSRFRGRDTNALNADALSDREVEILELVASGLSSREIAAQLRISIKTVESHREHIKSKLGLKHASELVNYAYTWRNNR